MAIGSQLFVACLVDLFKLVTFSQRSNTFANHLASW